MKRVNELPLDTLPAQLPMEDFLATYPHLENKWKTDLAKMNTQEVLRIRGPKNFIAPAIEFIRRLAQEVFVSRGFRQPVVRVTPLPVKEQQEDETAPQIKAMDGTTPENTLE